MASGMVEVQSFVTLSMLQEFHWQGKWVAGPEQAGLDRLPCGVLQLVCLHLSSLIQLERACVSLEMDLFSAFPMSL